MEEMAMASTTLTPDTKVRPSARVYAREFGDEIVLLDFAGGEYFGLDEIGAEVWRRLEAGDALKAIADRLVERYEVTVDVALDDIFSLIEELMARTLIETY